MTRPRRASGTMTWMSVFDDAICSMMKYPTGSRSSTDGQNDRENENSIRLIPNPAQHTETHFPSPFTPERTAKVSAPNSAPTPAAPIRIPNRTAPRSCEPISAANSCPPPCKILSAKIGISTT